MGRQSYLVPLITKRTASPENKELLRMMGVDAIYTHVNKGKKYPPYSKKRGPQNG